VKLDLETLPTVPDAPPAAGPDRALDPPPAGPGTPAGRLPDAGGAADAEGDVARPTESPITGDITAVAKSKCRTFRRRGLLAMVTEAGEGVCDGGGAAPAPPALPANDGSDVALGAERVEGASWSVGSYSFIMLLFFLNEASHRLLAVHVSFLQATCGADRSSRRVTDCLTCRVVV
jgi:hypothetical protein